MRAFASICRAECCHCPGGTTANRHLRLFWRDAIQSRQDGQHRHDDEQRPQSKRPGAAGSGHGVQTRMSIQRIATSTVGTMIAPQKNPAIGLLSSKPIPHPPAPPYSGAANSISPGIPVHSEWRTATPMIAAHAAMHAVDNIRVRRLNRIQLVYSGGGEGSLSHGLAENLRTQWRRPGVPRQSLPRRPVR